MARLVFDSKACSGGRPAMVIAYIRRPAIFSASLLPSFLRGEGRRGPAHVPCCSLRRHPDRFRMRVGGVLIDASFDLVAEMAEPALHPPGCPGPEGPDPVPFVLLPAFHQPVDSLP